MARLSEEQINEIRQKANIADIVSHYVSLTPKGRNYVCLCPFHDDHDPSMSVNTDKQIFKCFVCNTGGNVFSFVQKYEKISFVESVIKVAQLANIPIDFEISSIPKKVIDPHIEKLHKICKDTQEFTNFQLDSADAVSIKEYLHKRGINDELIKKFQLGYHPLNQKLYRFLSAKKHADEDMIEAGVVRSTEFGMKDIFSHRIMIPIHDAYGNTIGFSARRISNDDFEAKYINTSETTLFHKGDILFNYHRVKELVKHSRKVFLVEGAMDVIAMEKAGIPNSVATLGTACTKEQIKLLKKLHVPVIVCYDGDNAGKNATYKFGLLAKEAGLPFEIVNNQLGLDPDEIIDTYGKEELVKLCENSIPWIEFLFDYYTKRFNLENYSQKKEYAVEMGKEIKALSDDFEKQNYLLRLTQLTGFDMSEPKNERQPVRKRRPERTFLEYPKDGYRRAEYEILSMMMISQRACNLFKEKLGFMISENCNQLSLFCIDYYRNFKEMDVSAFLDFVKDEKLQNLILDIVNWEIAPKDFDERLFEDACIKIRKRIIDVKIAQLKEESAKLNDPLRKAVITDKIIELVRKKGELNHE